MVILLNEVQDSHPPLKIHNEKRVAKTNGLEINQGSGCGVKGCVLMFWVDFHSKLHQFKFSFAPNGHESYSEISIKQRFSTPQGICSGR